MRNPKQKGAAFERLVCVKLSIWLSKGNREDLLWRSSMSGGRSTVAFGRGKRFATQAGDISSIDPAGSEFTSKFMTECKNYKDLNLVGLLSTRGHLVEFWEEAKKQAEKYDKLPLLIAKQNHQPEIACLTCEGVALLRLQMHPILIAPKLDMKIVLFDDFLKYAVQP